MNYYFKIASIKFQISTEFNIDWHPFIRKFLTSNNDNISYHYQCYVDENLPKPIGTVINHTENLIVYKKGNDLEDRIYMLPLFREPLIHYQEISNENRILYINKKYLPLLIQSSSFQIFNSMALERALIKKDAFILHSSYIIHNNQAILFTAPSGTGKSTQANLWKEYANAEIVNGDRTLLTQENGIWYANGFPVCGSSKICVNKKAPLKAIVYLEQSLNNTVEYMPLSWSVKKVMSETSINYWNIQFVDKVITLLTDLCSKVPIYYYQCTKEKAAVDYLEKHLER